jgi:hypothetical protein
MVSREYGKCIVCDQQLILRVGIGLENVCQHTFDCPKCFTAITIEARLGEPPAAWIEMKENIKRIDKVIDAAVTVNLHPSFAFRLADYHSPVAFASMQAARLIHPHARVPADSRLIDVALHFEVPQTAQIWPIVKNILALAVKVDPANVLQSQVARYELARREFKPSFRCTTAFKAAASFLDDIFFPAIGNLRAPLRLFAKDLSTANDAEFQRLIDFYIAELQQQSFDRYLSTFADYFKYFDQFRQILAHARVGDEAVDDLIVGSKRFDDIKLYYGQAYETLTSSYTFLAALFNLSKGRKFDSFNSMTLKKYMSDVEKAKRSNPFLDVPVLASFTKFEDSALRNGSHHASIWRDGELVKFRSGGTGAEREMSFSRYIHACNGITIAIAALFLVELEFVSAIRL